MDKYVFTVNSDGEGKRADKYLADNLEQISRSALKDVFDGGEVFIGTQPVKPSYKLKAGEILTVCLPEVRDDAVKAEDIPIDVVYEDADVAVVNKPQGMVVHPAPGNYSGTLVNALMYRLESLSAINGVIRPGIVHRIDKDTSGLLVVAKNDTAHLSLASQFAAHSVTRVYRAFVHGTFAEKQGVIDAPIGRDKYDRKAFTVTAQNSKHAVTHYEVNKVFEDRSFLSLRLETGRTHQIRVHMKYISHPVIGDKLYGRDSETDRLFAGQLLHATVIGFTHPHTGEYMSFESDLPDYFSLLM